MAKFNFKQSAQESTLLSKLMSGRDKLTTEEILDKVVTIVAFDFATIRNDDGEDEVFPVLLFEEYPDKYYNSGAIMKKVTANWAAAFGGDPEAASKALADAGGVQVKFTSTRTRKGNNLINCDFV